MCLVVKFGREAKGIYGIENEGTKNDGEKKERRGTGKERGRKGGD